MVEIMKEINQLIFRPNINAAEKLIRYMFQTIFANKPLLSAIGVLLRQTNENGYITLY